MCNLESPIFLLEEMAQDLLAQLWSMFSIDTAASQCFLNFEERGTLAQNTRQRPKVEAVPQYCVCICCSRVGDGGRIPSEGGGIIEEP